MMAESTKRDMYRRTDNGKFLCVICNAELSSKQRILIHLHKVHNLTPLKRAKKKYLDDESVRVPRTTLFRWKKQRLNRPSAQKVLCYSDSTSDEEIPNVVDQHYSSLVSHESFQKDHDQSPTSTNKIDGETLPLSPTANPESVYGTGYRDDSLKDQSPSLYLPTSDSDLSVSYLPPMPSSPLGACVEEDPLSSESLDLNGDTTQWSDSEPSNKSIFSPCVTSSSSSSDSYNSDTESSAVLSSENDSDQEDIHIENSDQATEASINSQKREFQSLSLLSCFFRNKLSASSCKDIVETLKKTFPDYKDFCSLDLNEMLSYAATTPAQEIHYCIKCNKLFPEDKDIVVCETIHCGGLRYKGSMANQQNKSRRPIQGFVFTDVKKQLVDLLQTPGIWMDIQDTKKQAFERFEDGSTNITDILDGSAYRAMMSDDGFLSSMTNNLTAVFNTDGVSLYSSSKIELWPIFLAINELSPQKRFSRDNILLVGLWQGKGKPPFREFFEVFSKFMNPLYTDGVRIEIEEKAYTVKLSVVCGIADLPAKAELLNMSYFNGTNACISCEEPGITVQQGRGTARCFPYKLQGTRCQSRTHESTLQHMESGTQRNRSAGFKGISGLSYLQNFNIVKGTVPDYMHGVLLGVTKSLMTRWFSPSHSQQEYFIGKHLEEISGRMKNLKPPESIERLPRDLEKHYLHFKATELQSWLLYYAFPCVQGLLKEEYLENLSYLSEGIHILLGDNITQESLEKAIDLLDQFYSSFQRLYGDGSCGLNVHNTGLHLPEYVKLWGPVWAWSCFPFEDANAMLLQAVHGTGLVLQQVVKHRQVQSCIRRKGLDLSS